MKRVVVPAVAFVMALVLMIAGFLRDPPARGNVATTPPASQEERAYRSLCGSCHPAYDASAHRKDEWRGIVEDMHLRAEDRGFDASAEEFELAVRFLEENGR